MRIAAASMFLVLATSGTLSAADPARDLAEARRLIDQRQFRQAVVLLDTAQPAAAALPADDRAAALGAVHFYSALAHFGLDDHDATRRHLEEFFDVSRHASINAARYPRGFVDAFNNVSEAKNRDVVTFDRFYPGFDESAEAAAPPWVGEEGTWGSSPALRFLGSRDEKRDWETLMGTENRAAFIRAFWERRDPTPGTERNEAKETFERRVAFADRVFPAEGERGALTDRGRIFVILGAPSMVQRRALTNRDNVRIVHAPIVDGTMELWVYSKEQLLVEIPKRAVQYRFVTQKEHGVGILQKNEEPYATRVLAASGEATIRR
jgi:GWxTD domain-containing protein